MFAFQDTRDAVDVAFTDRHGGMSVGPTASLNLGVVSGDDPDTVDENTDIVAYAFARGHEDPENLFGLPEGVPTPVVATMRQVHGGETFVVDEAHLSAFGAPPTADALVTQLPGVVLMTRVADCVPVLIADVEQRVVAAVHAGRMGLVAGVVPSAVDAMSRLGAGQLVGWVGPHACGRCYEVPEEMREQVAAVVPQAYAVTSWGTASVDLGAGVRAQLQAAGVEVVDGSRCTIEDTDLFSHRRQGKQAGRMAGLVWVRP